MPAADPVFQSLVSTEIDAGYLVDPGKSASDITVSVAQTFGQAGGDFAGDSSTLFVSIKSVANDVQTVAGGGSLVTSVVSAVGDIAKLASGIGTAVSAVTGVLGMFGIKFGNSDLTEIKDEIKNIDKRLQNIDSQLTNIQKSLSDIKQALVDLGVKVDEDFQIDAERTLSARCAAIRPYLTSLSMVGGNNLPVSPVQLHVDFAVDREKCMRYGYATIGTVAAAMAVEMALLAIVNDEAVTSAVSQAYTDFFSSALDLSVQDSLGSVLQSRLYDLNSLSTDDQLGRSHPIYSGTVYFVAPDDHGVFKARDLRCDLNRTESVAAGVTSASFEFDVEILSTKYLEELNPPVNGLPDIIEFQRTHFISPDWPPAEDYFLDNLAGATINQIKANIDLLGEAQRSVPVLRIMAFSALCALQLARDNTWWQSNPPAGNNVALAQQLTGQAPLSVTTR